MYWSVWGLGETEGREEEKKVADRTATAREQKNNLGPCESGFLMQGDKTRRNALHCPQAHAMQCQQRDMMRTCLDSWVDASWLCSHAPSNHPDACELMRRPADQRGWVGCVRKRG